MADLSKVIGFEWDEGNARKNEQHGVSMAEAEQVFFNAPLLVLPDSTHSETEPRFHALGKTIEGRVTDRHKRAGDDRLNGAGFTWVKQTSQRG